LRLARAAEHHQRFWSVHHVGWNIPASTIIVVPIHGMYLTIITNCTATVAAVVAATAVHGTTSGAVVSVTASIATRHCLSSHANRRCRSVGVDHTMPSRHSRHSRNPLWLIISHRRCLDWHWPQPASRRHLLVLHCIVELLSHSRHSRIHQLRWWVCSHVGCCACWG